MKYKFQMTIVCRAESEGQSSFDVHSFDMIQAETLTSLLGQLLVVIGSLHQRILSDLKTEKRIIDDDIPF